MNGQGSFRIGFIKIKIALGVFSLLISLSVFGQTTNISGVINSYTSINSIDCVSRGEITVANSASFSVGQQVLVIQMKGASMDESNTSSFGDVSAYNGAGTYELNQITSISGNTIDLLYSMNPWFDSNEGLQLISIPEYDIANVNGTLSAQAWDGSTGGVLIFFANQVTMNANINLDGIGFRGGQLAGQNGSSNLTSYYFSSSTGEGGFKGEGIATEIVNKECGRGAQVNGGGGGNAHNAGAGGGSNYGAGGFGGTWSSQSTETRGIGGKAQTNVISDDKAYLGGGGGAGQQNNNQAGIGGNGGGIVIIRANSLVGNAYTLSVNGSDGQDAPNNDGSGGAGAAGTVLLDIPSFSGNLTINAFGGIGGDNPAAHGPGGGGGGGVVYSNSALPGSVLTDVSGGVSGTYAGDPRNATDGSVGIVTTGLTLVQASNLNVEICGNGADDDCDGLTDCFDSDCTGDVTCPDLDGDGIADEIDVDDDGDGILDLIEDNGCTDGSLNYEFYDLAPSGNTVYNIPTSGATLTGTANTFNVDGLASAITGSTDTYSIRYLGFINIATAGSYTFYISSDDGSRLLIDGSEILVYDGLHGCGTRNSSTTLNQGIFSIQIEMFENTGGACLVLEYEGPGISRQSVPFGIFSTDICDTDNDGLVDNRDIDSDGDGIPDNIESQGSSSYISPSNTDEDNDGLDDAYDPDCTPCASNGTQINPQNFDGLDEPDYLDSDSDNDNTLDVTEGWDTDFDGVPNSVPLSADSDSDGLDDAFDKDSGSTNSTGASNGAVPTDFPNSNSFGEPNWRNGAITLPVDLILFQATAQNDRVLLEWVTASEVNNDYFLIERSDDAQNWYSAVLTQGQGNSSVLVHYKEYDNEPFSGINYYRLTQFDFDGTYSESDIVSAYIHGSPDYVVFPNPASDFIRIKGVGEFSDNQHSEVELYDTKGQKIEIQTRFFDDELFITFPQTVLNGNFLIRIEEETFLIQILNY
ncbi:MAG: PA14 domain-containing protein [Bacteroidota bacterium]